MLQRYGDEFDGILAISPAVYWDRWGYAAGWTNYLANDLIGAPSVTPAKYAAVNNAARAHCDGVDGIVDGSIQDTRRCTYDAKSFVCKGDGTDPANCLTPNEAIVVNQTWRGISEDWARPRRDNDDDRGWGHDHDKKDWWEDDNSRIFYGWERGTNAPGSVANGSPSRHGEEILRFWVKRDAAFDWKTLSPEEFLKEIRVARKLFGGYIGSDSVKVDKFRRNRGKMIATYGNADATIPPNLIYHYYNRLMGEYGGARKTQDFYRFFMFPDAGHCGGAGMNTEDLFTKLVSWVESDVEPDHYVAQVNPTRTRKVCMYPNVATYKGSGSTDDEANFYCKVNKSDPLIKTVDVDNIEKANPVTTLGHEDDDDHDHDHHDHDDDHHGHDKNDKYAKK